MFNARADAGTTRVVLDPASFALDNVRSGVREVMSIAPGMQIVRLVSASGPMEVAVHPADAEALVVRFPRVGA